jgi:hypothetical protein
MAVEEMAVRGRSSRPTAAAAAPPQSLSTSTGDAPPPSAASPEPYPVPLRVGSAGWVAAGLDCGRGRDAVPGHWGASICYADVTPRLELPPSLCLIFPDAVKSGFLPALFEPYDV